MSAGVGGFERCDVCVVGCGGWVGSHACLFIVVGSVGGVGGLGW